MATATAELAAYWTAGDGCEAIEVERLHAKPLRIYFESEYELRAMLRDSGLAFDDIDAIRRDLNRCRHANDFAEYFDDEPTPPETETQATRMPPAVFSSRGLWWWLWAACGVILALVWINR